MYWLIFLLILILFGYILQEIFLPEITGILKTANAFILGSFFSINFLYFISSFLTFNLTKSLILYFIVFLITILIVLLKQKNILKKTFFNHFKKNELTLFIIIFICSFYLFLKTFNYDVETGEFLIASNIYLDFGSHIPFIRSFSLGNNFPAEVPFFANQGLIYHFMFDLYAGVLEFLGLRIDIAFNLISTTAFSFLLIYIYKIATLIFKNNKIVGFLSVILFLFNSNLSFINFFKKFGLGLSTISAFWQNPFYFDNSTVPFNGDFSVAGFWNLNTYFNQRHFIFALLIVLFLIYILILFKNKQSQLKKRTVFLFSVIIGLLPYWHTMLFLAIMILLIAFFVLESRIRKLVLIIIVNSLIMSTPELLTIKIHSSNTIIFKPGFLISENLTFLNFIRFWFYNLGVAIFTILYGFIKSNREQRKIFLIFMSLFLIPNLFQFSTRFSFDDHKFFNLWVILVNTFSAYAIYLIYKKHIYGKLLSFIIILSLTLSGYISIMVTKNDVYTRILDYPKNNLLNWVLNNIPNKATMLTNGEIYDPVSLVGRKITIGRAHYIFVYGGNPDGKLYQQEEILLGENIDRIQRIINKSQIDYIIFYKNNFAKNSKPYKINLIEKNFQKLYDDENGTIFKI